ncbi:pectin lyase fold/virulence factor [Aspergillus arachidicola]|uniref:galacturonan 1,4-alpha-galacturonidase n=1 Tax=Aspergillus arachidicola TaxID=656916 RepID=A0A5N6XYC1_9EURO|nr:pectin lyase fold/virulence factor [Aspergillus arachidicola]
MRWLSTPLVAVSLSLGLSAISHASQIEHKGNICTTPGSVWKYGNGGIIVFPENQSYWIASRLNPILSDVTIEWPGERRDFSPQFSDDLDYWRNHSYPVAFQNHAAGFVITGRNITIDGYGTEEAGKTQPGRPMPFVFWNVSNIHVDNFYFNNINCNVTAIDAPYGANWVQNTDGFDTMNARNIRLTNFVYQGGDHCVTIKPRSYDVDIHNVTCRGGMASPPAAAYIKTCIGVPTPQDSYESAGLPRGGGWGNVSNIIFSKFEVQGANTGPMIYQNEGNNGSYAGTSLMTVSDITFANFTAYVTNENEVTSNISCSENHPCYDIDFDNVLLNITKSAGKISENRHENCPIRIRSLFHLVATSVS